MTRRNLAVNPNATQGTTGWVGVNRGQLTAGLVGARRALEFTTGFTNGVVQLPQSGIGSAEFIPILPDMPYSIAAEILNPNTGSQPIADANFQIRVLWYREDFTSTGTAFVSPITDVDAGDPWTRLTQGGRNNNSPSDARFAKIQILQITAGTFSGTKFYVDSVLFEQSEYVGAYIDNYTKAEEREIVNRALSAFYDRDPFNELELNADVELGSLVLNTIDENGYVWICSDIDGWWTLPDSDLPDIPRGVRDGSYDVSGRYAARLFTLTGSVFVPNKEDVDTARQKLISSINLVRQGAWLKTSENPTRAAFVRLNGRPNISTVNARGRTEFSVGLKAADPIKYKWDDSNVEGISSKIIDLKTAAPAENKTVNIVNEGDAIVTADLIFTGPLGAGSTVVVKHLDPATSNPVETLTVIGALRGANNIATVTNIEISEKVATITTLEPHGLAPGESIQVTGTSQGILHGPENIVSAVTETPPFTFSFPIAAVDIPNTLTVGTVRLVRPDVMAVDTYHRNVIVNGLDLGYRSKLETLVDWVTLEPGVNDITFTDSVDVKEISRKEYFFDPAVGRWRGRLTTNSSHFLNVNDPITVNLSERVSLAFKEISDFVGTMTTERPHGFSVGDNIEVTTIATTNVVSKALNSDTNAATLTFSSANAIQVGDTVLVALPVVASVSEKTRTNNTVTLKTNVPHGFSTGDTVVVAMPIDANATQKSLTDNQATITTALPHNFSLSDLVRITLPSTTNVVSRTVAGTLVTLATESAHGFSVGDTISVALPVTATLANTRGLSNTVVTLNTTTAHNFSIGDAISVAPGVDFAVAITSRASAGATRTVTTPGHKFSVGELVTISGLSAAYNGTFIVSAVSAPASTFSYVGLSTVTEGATLASGLAVNVTIRDAYTTVPFLFPISSRAATASNCLLTAEGHQFVVGDSVTISNVSARYNGTHTLTFSDQVLGTFGYNFSGVSEASTLTTAGTVVNNTVKFGPRGSKILTAASGNSLQYRHFSQGGSTSSTAVGVAPVLNNITNSDINGSKVLSAVTVNTLVFARGE